MVKAEIEEHGDMVLVKTEYNQYAVIPRDKLCELIARFHLEITNKEIHCEIKRVGGEDYLGF